MFSFRGHFCYIIDIVDEKLDKTASEKVSCKTWAPPSGWTGPDAVLYRGFCDSDGLVLMEGTSQLNYLPLVSGKVRNLFPNCLQNELKYSCIVLIYSSLQVNKALALDHTQSQWVDLGIHTEACMTRPDTCGAAGGAISLWVIAIACSGGIVSSKVDGSSGSVIFCHYDELWYDALLFFIF